MKALSRAMTLDCRGAALGQVLTFANDRYLATNLASDKGKKVFYQRAFMVLTNEGAIDESVPNSFPAANTCSTGAEGLENT